jgi:hypothetical protein
VLGLDDQPALAAWPGGEPIPVCIPWAASEPWIDIVKSARAWSSSGQPIGQMWDQTPALVDALSTIRSEWDTIHAEAAERSRSSS